MLVTIKHEKHMFATWSRVGLIEEHLLLCTLDAAHFFAV